MVSITIDGTEFGIEDTSIIVQQANRRRDAGARVCVQVRINHGSISMVLSTLDCPAVGGTRSREQARPDEERIFSLWKKHGLRKENFSGGQVVAFLKRLPTLLP